MIKCKIALCVFIFDGNPMIRSPLTEYRMKDIVSYYEYMNEYGYIQRYYINGGFEGGLKR